MADQDIPETNELGDLKSGPSEGRVSISSVEAINEKTLDEIELDTLDQGEEAKEEEIQDPSITKYIDACQRGDLPLVKSMIESSEVTVKTLGHDGVSGLHWAAINNRLSVAKYLVNEGAEVDARGGDLNATPLHWACRYGLVYIADFLIRGCDANPELIDNQGFNCLHLAVHSSNIMLVIYLLNFTNIPVDSVDPSKRTSLHWAAYQGDSLTVDLLLKYGANVTSRDLTEFTPLHWSLIRGVSEVIKPLIEHGANVHDKNSDGKDCFLVASDMNSTKNLYLALKENGFNKNGTPVRALMTPKTAKIVTFFQPYCVLFLAFKTLSLSQHWVIPKLFLVLLILLINHFLLMKVVLPCYSYSSNPLMRTPYFSGIFSGTTFWVLVMWFSKILPQTFDNHWFLNIVFFISSATVISTFLKCFFINPGFIPTPAKRENIQSTIVELIHLRKFDSKNFCIYTFIRKPLRSKFSWYSKKNVAKFDHYCPWVFNEIGIRNHKLFVTFILSLAVSIFVFMGLSISYFDKMQAEDVTCQYLSSSLCKGYYYEPFLFNLFAWSGFQSLWLSFLIFVQSFQILKGLTSWEAANIHKHGIDPNGNTRNPFYSSVPTDAVENELPSVSDDQSTNRGSTQQGSQVRPHSEPKFGCIRSLLTNSSVSKTLGLDLFLMTASDAVSMKKSFTSTDYGVKRNLLDFWFIKNEALGEGYSCKTLIRLPIEGEGNLNGKLVDYYKLWELPAKGDSLV